MKDFICKLFKIKRKVEVASGVAWIDEDLIVFTRNKVIQIPLKELEKIGIVKR